MTTTAIAAVTVAPRSTGNPDLDALLAAIDEKPGQEVGRVARRAGIDKGAAGRVLAWAEGIGYVRVERVKGKRTYHPAV